ncbi:flagellar basal-body rod protein FlgG [Paenibacillus sp. UNCCL117]|uniref:flagellar hook-basal body protein n=1 Tax=unclassified Paenibacillus TaxID=185978 RepID=UPI0008850BD2|nr:MULTISPECIES: flagellar hook-basal body protein [unclassified Paenibacillus]SDE34569.1 flagellar basal-body rod protein FlgG [Paenibacillus sp. cl123]SFW64308.1 flagellar basal-body rod protein FlgG [Paenibacillus sp. UNCCL117]
MNNSMINSSVSMHALQQKLDLLANNISNVNTTGYKRKEASFQDVLTSVKQQPQSFQKEGRLTPLGYNQGWGSKLVEAQINMEQGSLQNTLNPLDFAIEGNGLFEIATVTLDANNEPVQTVRWTRNGAFDVSPSVDPGDPDGYLTTKDGHYIVGTDNNPIRVPANHRLTVQPNGLVIAYDETDRTAPPVELGQIKTVRVVRPQLLQQVGENLYALSAAITPEQREEILQTVTEENNTVDPITVRQGFIEQSNVNLSEEMTELVMVQRAFQLNARAVASADQLMNLANNLRV